jgi:hypothetical protein
VYVSSEALREAVTFLAAQLFSFAAMTVQRSEIEDDA